MTSLSERLEAKRARRVVVPIPVSDPGDEARRAAARAAEALTFAETLAAATPDGIDASRLEQLRADEAATAAVIAEHTVDVVLKAMPSLDWETLVANFRLEDDDEDFDWRAMLPIALAECCEDESLRDEKAWTNRIESPEWAAGDVRALQLAVLRVNTWSPQVGLPKG